MSSVAALETYLRAQPGDWQSWLVYADWLTDQGDLRGTLIGLAHRRTHTTSDEEQERLQAQIEAICAEHRSLWLPADLCSAEDCTWRLGFVIQAKLSSNADPVRAFEALAAHPTGRFLDGLDLSGSGLDTDAVCRLAASDHARSLRELNLRRNNVCDDGVLAISASETLCALTGLYLRENDIEDAGARALAESDNLRTLARLYLSDNRISDEGARALATSEHLPALVELDLSWNHLADEGALLASATLHARIRLSTSEAFETSGPAQSLEQLEGVDWGPPTYDSSLVVNCHRLRRVPIREFSADNLRMMIGQDIGLPHLIPVALDLLEQDPFIDALYPGGLLSAVLTVEEAHWESYPEHRERVRRLIAGIYDPPEEIVLELTPWKSADMTLLV